MLPNFHTMTLQVVCPLMGVPVLSYSLQHSPFLPPCLEGCARGKEKLKVNKAVVVQDPFEVRRNVTAHVSSLRLEQLVRSCHTAAGVLAGLQLQEGSWGAGEGREEVRKLFTTESSTALEVETPEPGSAAEDWRVEEKVEGQEVEEEVEGLGQEVEEEKGRGGARSCGS